MSDLPIETLPTVGSLVATDLEADPDPEDIDYDALITEDHKPVESIFIEKQYRLLTHALYVSWPGPEPGRQFLVLTNVGWFYKVKTPAVVPDCLLSLDVTCPEDLQIKKGHSYYQWAMGKPPEVVIEFVSDRTGGEESFKKKLYARLGVSRYAVFDPKHLLSGDSLRAYSLANCTYQLTDPGPWPCVGLGLRLWEGKFEGGQGVWLRWCDANGEIVPTAEERAELAKERAELAEERIRQLEAELRRLKDEPPAKPK